ncbi:uncharacterized protein LOC124912141 [Impatiens glandulifera]|uniref:uncharacterized protein LOC124912141 n=1 Tax=Impatiens glandulifera TaxID=253017 RepID=UPI001FB11447|nr:uncharacterized protein LOC124912141 [Impatiens glandulifera]
MDAILGISSTLTIPITCSPLKSHLRSQQFILSRQFMKNINAISSNTSVSASCCDNGISSTSARGVHKQRSGLESLFCYDKAIPEEIIEKPIGLSMDAKNIGDNPSCPECELKGAVLCKTCTGSGLYVDSIMESQGIIVKVRCLGCGGTGNIMCSECGGRGHLGFHH